MDPESSDTHPGAEPDSAMGVDVDHLFRHHSGRMVASLVRALGWQHIELVEEAVQESFLAALRTWPYRGVPDQPSAWLTRVARNRALDQLRRSSTWQRKRDQLERDPGAPADGVPIPGAAEIPLDPSFAGEVVDDTLSMILACCHPQLSRDQQVALTLKTVGGFVVDEIARAFLSQPSTIAQRIVRAKNKLKKLDEPLSIPPPAELDGRLDVALEVVYLMFNEGYDSTTGDDLVRQDLCAEALRLVRLLAEHPRTSKPATHALAALLHFQASRFSQRTDARGDLLLLEHQDRSAWDPTLLSRAYQHLRRSASGKTLSSYHLQAEIASLHATAPSFADTNWTRIHETYLQLEQLEPSPVVKVNRLIAQAMAGHAESALRELGEPELSKRLSDYYPLHVARGKLLHESGDVAGARQSYERALELAGNKAVQDYLSQLLRDVKAS